MTLKIYPASSWRNKHYPDVVRALRAEGHDVYDFREANVGFRWSCQTLPEYIRQLENDPDVAAAFARDRDAMDQCDACVLVLPSGRSSHLEIAYAAGKGKLAIVLFDAAEPLQCELMYLLLGDVRFVTDITELLETLRAHEQKRHSAQSDRHLAEYALKLARNDIASAIRFLRDLGLPFVDACAAVEEVAGLDEAQPPQRGDPAEDSL